MLAPPHGSGAHAPQAAQHSEPEALVADEFGNDEARAVAGTMVCEFIRHHRGAKRLLHVVQNVPDIAEVARIPIRMLSSLTQSVTKNGMVWSSETNTKLMTRLMCPLLSIGR